MRVKVKPISECVQPTKRKTKKFDFFSSKVTRYFSFNRAIAFFCSHPLRICIFFSSYSSFVFLFLIFFFLYISSSSFPDVNMNKVFVACLRNMCAKCDLIEMCRECVSFFAVQHSNRTHTAYTTIIIIIFFIFFICISPFSFVLFSFTDKK